MTKARISILLLILGLVPALSAQSAGLPPGVVFVSKATRHIRETMTAAPNYTCLETIDREQLTPPARAFRRLDLVRIEVARAGTKELYSWPGGRRFEDRPITDFVAGGLVGDGTYGGYTDVLFLTSGASMKYRGPESLHGRPATRVDFVVSPLTNRIAIRTATGTGEIGYSGSYWVDPDTLDLIRVEVDADDIPFQLQLSSARLSTEFRTLKVGNKAVLLAQSSVLELVKLSGEISRDQIDFTQCREFSSQAALVPDSADAAVPPGEPATAPPRTFDLPENLTIPLRLSALIDTQSASVGDAVTAVVDADVKDRSRVWLPKGSVVHGRIRRLEHRRGNPDYMLLGIEFSEVDAGRDTAEFTARLQSLDSGVGLSMFHKESNVVGQTSLPNAGGRGAGSGMMTTVLESFDFELPGVGYLYLTSAPYRVPSNLRMTWKTQALRPVVPK